MSKYGNGIGMKKVISAEVEHVRDILSQNTLSDKDREDVMDILKEFAYQWCSSNAAACAIESAYRKLCPSDEDMHALCSEIMSSGVRDQVFDKTYPFS